MQVYKFGGAALATAQGMQQVGRIISSAISGNKALPLQWVVVSAMGKTTNALEGLVALWHTAQSTTEGANQLLHTHRQLAQALSLPHTVLEPHTTAFLATLAAPAPHSYHQAYDALVPFGELFSAALLHAHLQTVLQQGVTLIDARTLLHTTADHRKAQVHFAPTIAAIVAQTIQNPNTLLLTQGFIGRAPNGATTTLGREGSDYTAAVIAYATCATALTIWKDVPGVMTADPRLEPDATVLPALSYSEAIEMTFYGATVIHPRTIQPLQQAGIPLYVRSFVDVQAAGTCVSAIGPENALLAHTPAQMQPPYPPLAIYKRNQVLLTLKTRDLSFMAEAHLAEVFTQATTDGLTVNLSQNSALSLSLVVDGEVRRLAAFVRAMRPRFYISWNTDLELLTLRHLTEHAAATRIGTRPVLLEQRSRNTGQWLLGPALRL